MSGRRSFRLAQRAGKAICPPFPTLRVHNTRTGFVEREDFEAVLGHLPSEVQPVVIFAYVTGWRTRSEILPLTWRQVDFGAGTVRLEPGTTKNDEARVLPFAVLPELTNMTREQWNKTMEIQIETGTIIPWVFTDVASQLKTSMERGKWRVREPEFLTAFHTTSEGPQFETWNVLEYLAQLR